MASWRMTTSFMQSYIITMKQWLKRTQSPENSRIHHSPSHSREFKQVITRLSTGFTDNHFLAYCLVSKESSYGIFLNERLLVLDTEARELRYYSHIPQLPLAHPRDLPAPKEVIHIQPGVDFQVEKVRIGHVTIRWEEHRQPRLWKLIMGSNQIAREFHQLFANVLAAETEDAKAREVPIPKEYRISKAQIQEEYLPVIYEDKIKQNSITPKQPSLKEPNLQLAYESNGNIMKQSQSERLNISLYDSRRMKDEAETYFGSGSRYKFLQIHSPPKIQKQDNSLQKTGLMATQWLQARDQTERAAVYNKFLQTCIRKVEMMMQNFMTSHLMHQQYKGLHLIRDNDIEIYYVPLIDSTEQDLAPSFFSNLRQEEAMLEEWQCMNYLSTFRKAKDVYVVVPMACLLAYKSFKFYCKNSLEMYPHKQRLLPSLYQEELTALEEISHMLIRNGKQEIYIIEQGNQKIIYIDHASCLPKITPFLPVSPIYLELFLTRGKVSNQKDIQAISLHISNKLIKKTLENLGQKSFSTSCQVMDFIRESGLSEHYLSFFLTNEQQQYIFVSRLITSELVACAAQWEIRRRMQVQLFKKREFGFSINQLRTAIALLLQEDKYFASILDEILKNMFNYRLPLPMKNAIQPQAMVISIFNKLGFDCRGAFLDAEQLEWAWSEKYINDYIELTPFVNAALLRCNLFTPRKQVLQNVIGKINYQINTEIKLEQVLDVLGLHKNSSGLYPVTPNYVILPTTLKQKVNYYLSHFIAPSFEPAPQQSLQSLIYGDSFALTSPNPHYYTHTIQHLTTLNKVRWLARMKYIPRVQELLEREVEQATTWNQLHLLIQIYSFAAKLKLRQGEISIGLQCSLKALQYALKQYERQPTVLMKLVIAEQAFQAANFHFNVHNFSKALDLYSTVEGILSKISTSSDQIILNPQFLDLYVNKCSIYLLFGDYGQCFQQCLSSLKSCNKFNKQIDKLDCIKKQFQIYQILFRCYQIKNMRKELTEVTCICCQRYFQDPCLGSQQPNLHILASLIKMLWISVIKQIECLSTTRISDLSQSAKLKTIYLKKVRKELKQLRVSLNEQHRYTQQQAATFMVRKIFKYNQSPDDCRLLMATIDCLSEVTLNSRTINTYRLFDKQSLENQWLTLEMMGVLAGYDFLVGCIDDYLRIYDYQH